MYRLEEFNDWMAGVENTVADLEKESLSTKEYKDTLEKFQVIIIFSVFS